MKRLRELKFGRYPPAVTAYTDTDVLEVVRGMAERWVRHAPIVERDTMRLRGMISARDVIDFIGGGSKFRIVFEKYYGDLYRALTLENALSIGYRPPYVTLDHSLFEVVDIMIKHNIGALAVVDENDRVVGMISERHLMNLFADVQMFVMVSEIMSKPLISLPPQANLIEGLEVMYREHIRRLVLRDSGGLKGILTVKDILKFLAKDEVLERIKIHGKEALYKTPISAIAVPNVVTIEPRRDLGEAIKVMRRHRIGSLVVKEDDDILGIITERDFTLKLPKLLGVEMFIDEAQKLILMGRVFL